MKKYRSDDPNYIKVYLNDIVYLYDLPNGCNDIIFELFDYITFNTHEIILNKTIKDRISKKIGMKLGTIDNNLTKLKQKGVLESRGRGVYFLNPYLFGKGHWKELKELREQNLHLEITYDKNTNERVIKGSIDTQKTFNFDLEDKDKKVS